MKKLRLELEQLSVESFYVPLTAEAPGTVRANAGETTDNQAAAGTTDWVSYLLFGTCDYSCNCTLGNTCPHSCANTVCANYFCRNQTTTYVHMVPNDTIPVDE